MTGAAELLEDEEDDHRRRAIRLLRGKYSQYREMDIDANPVIKITPLSRRSLVLHDLTIPTTQRVWGATGTLCETPCALRLCASAVE